MPFLQYCITCEGNRGTTVYYSPTLCFSLKATFHDSCDSAQIWKSPYYSVACMVGLSEPALLRRWGSLNVHCVPVFFLAIAAGLWIFSEHAGFSEGVSGCSTSYFYAHAQPGTQICKRLFICWVRCASLWGYPSPESA